MTCNRTCPLNSVFSKLLCCDCHVSANAWQLGAKLSYVAMHTQTWFCADVPLHFCKSSSNPLCPLGGYRTSTIIICLFHTPCWMVQHAFCLQDSWSFEWQKNTIRRAELDLYCCDRHHCMEYVTKRYQTWIIVDRNCYVSVAGFEQSFVIVLILLL